MLLMHPSQPLKSGTQVCAQTTRIGEPSRHMQLNECSTAAACQGAAAFHGGTFYNVGTNPADPSGCFVFFIDVYFNADPTGVGVPNRRPLCSGAPPACTRACVCVCVRVCVCACECVFAFVFAFVCAFVFVCKTEVRTGLGGMYGYSEGTQWVPGGVLKGSQGILRLTKRVIKG